MSSAVTTTCCGLAIVVGLQLPGSSPPPSSVVQAGPALPSYEVIWRKNIAATGAVELFPAEQALIISSPSAPIVARSLTDGRELWSATQPSLVTPALAGSLLFVAERVEGADGAAGHSLSAIAVDTGARIWTVPFDEPISQVAAGGDRVIAIAATSVRCLQSRDGGQIWRQRLPFGVVALMLAALGEAPLPALVRPALDATRVYLAATPSTLAAWDLATGVELWRVPMEIPAEDLTVGRDRLLVRGYQRGLFSMNARNGWVDWPLRSAIVVGKPAVGDNRVYLALLDNTVVSLDSRGARRWKADLPDRAFTGPRVLGETVFVPLVSGEVAAIDRQSGILTKRDPAAIEIRPFQAFAASADAQWVFAVMTDFGSARTLSALRRR